MQFDPFSLVICQNESSNKILLVLFAESSNAGRHSSALCNMLAAIPRTAGLQHSG